MDKEIVLIGVGHVFNIKEKIKELIAKEAPEAIAIELDEKRLGNLLYPKKSKGLNIYSILSLSQAIIAKKFGVFAGNEMIAAIEKAKEDKIPFFCIDMDAYYIVNKLWKSLSFKNKIKLMISLLSSIFLSKERIKKEVDRIQEDGLTQELEKYFPEIKKILIDERNKYMATNLINLISNYNKIVAIVGEGHLKGMEELLKDFASIKITHLKDYLN